MTQFDLACAIWFVGASSGDTRMTERLKTRAVAGFSLQTALVLPGEVEA